MAVFKKNELFAGRYILVELIGEGGFSEVWKAQDEMANEAIVAIKIYAPEKGLDSYGIRQFRQEYSITHHLSHPHLMKVYYFDIADGSPYLIMPYYQQGSLCRYIQDKKTFNERQVALLMCQMGSALAELHGQQPPILHQDIKPDNILIQSSKHFILTDFGISSQTRHTLKKSTSNMKSLTMGYAPPERFDRVPVSNEASDIFSLGVTIYEMCTGKVPWDGFGGQSLLKGAQIPDLPAHFPSELNKMIRACMSLEWAARPTAEQLIKWGKLYLEQDYWRYEETKSKPVWTRVYTYLALAVVGLLLVGSILKFYPIKEDTPKNIPPVISTSISSNTIKEASEESDSEVIDSLQSPSTEVPLTDKSQSSNSFVIPKPVTDSILEEYLNKISDKNIPTADRRKWKGEVLKLFAASAQAFDKKNGLLTGYAIDQFLDLIFDMPHTIKVVETIKDSNDRITELHLQTSFQPK